MAFNCNRCINCKIHFTSNKTRVTKCGPPIIKCQYCNKLNHTNLKLYRDLKAIEKVHEYLNHFLASLFLFGLMVYLIYQVSDSLTAVLVLFIILVSIIFLLVIDMLNKKKLLKKTEKVFEINGGFVWSHQYFP